MTGLKFMHRYGEIIPLRFAWRKPNIIYRRVAHPLRPLQIKPPAPAWDALPGIRKRHLDPVVSIPPPALLRAINDHRLILCWRSIPSVKL